MKMHERLALNFKILTSDAQPRRRHLASYCFCFLIVAVVLKYPTL